MSTKPAKRIVVVDYGMGNLKSVVNALLFLRINALVSNKKQDIITADAIILPGVGAFGEAMKNLQNLGLIDTLHDQVMEKKKPFLGICLGMQLIADGSDEFGLHKGLGWIHGHVKKLDVGQNLRLPHIGWNDIQIIKQEPLFTGITVEPVYYFVHSFHFECEEKYIAAKCRYGSDFAAAVHKDNIFATQFHPEKSQHKGLRLMRNFMNHVESRGQ